MKKASDFPKKLLLLSCCAPCAVGVIELLAEKKIDTTILFFNPNIQPFSEYEKRRDEQRKTAVEFGFSFIELDYDLKGWENVVAGLEDLPERSKRCSKCFEFRLRRTAEFAQKNNFQYFADVLGISRWKDLNQVHLAGKKVNEDFSELIYFNYNWRENGGANKMIELGKKKIFYRQTYCGCRFSQLKETREKNGK